MAASKQITPTEQWLLLLVPTVLVFGLAATMGRKKSKGTRGVGGCGCGCNNCGPTAGLGYTPGGALVARHAIQPPVPWR